MKRLACRPMSAKAFASFGTVIDPAGAPAELINSATTRRYSDLARLDLRGPATDPALSIYEASAREFPLPLTKLERHLQASQVFLPLGRHCFIVVVAPGDAMPAWQQVSAFITRPGQGVSLRRCCWHHGLIALGDGDRFAVVEGGNYRADTEEVDFPLLLELDAPDY
jgi:ureidoglycolate lyase